MTEATRAKPYVFSGDGHCGAGVATYARYADAKHRDAILSLVAEEAAFAEITGKVRTSYVIGEDEAADAIASDPVARLQAMDVEMIDREILFPGVHRRVLPGFASSNEPASPELQRGGAQAYNRWLAEVCAADPRRLLGVMQLGAPYHAAQIPPCVEWGAQNGMVAVEAPGRLADQDIAPLHSISYDPFWGSCVENKMLVSFHAGWGDSQGVVTQRARRAYRLSARRATAERVGLPATPGTSSAPMVFDILWPIRRALVELIWGRVFERWPRLLVVLAEVGITWLPPFVYQLDLLAASDPDWRGERLPSEYFREHVYVVLSSPTAEDLQTAATFWPDNVLVGSDMPHDEGTWPVSAAWWSTAAATLSPNVASNVLAGNAARMMSFVGPPAVAAEFTPGDMAIGSDRRIAALVARVQATGA
jgi:predicted TIM-barrel fold metal-dependent hydrolase